MTDAVYYDKVYGGWLGKCLGGAAGAPVEGIKKLIPCEDFREMIRPDLPGDRQQALRTALPAVMKGTVI